VLVVASTFPARPGDGTPRFVLDLAREQARVMDVTVLAPLVPGAPKQETLDGVKVRRFAFLPGGRGDLADGAMLENLRERPSRAAQVPPFLLAETWAVRQRIRQWRPDVLHLHWTIPQGVVALLADRRTPRIVTSHGADAYALAGRLPSALKSSVLRRADAVTAVNDQIAQRLIALGAPADRTSVIPMGVNVEVVNSVGLDVPRVPGRIVFVGRLVEKKGVRFLLDALRALPKDLDWSAEIVGDGPLRGSLEAAAAGLPVRFLGATGERDVYRRLAAATVAVVPSVPSRSGDQDGLPVSMLEAMAAGCAIVASRLPGLDVAIADGTHGRLVPPGDVTALAGALGELLTHPDQTAAFGAAALRRADSFSVQDCGRRYVDVLWDAMRRQSPPPVSTS
jgi:glycosyltransferase involved in cell wall biosynthesis